MTVLTKKMLTLAAAACLTGGFVIQSSLVQGEDMMNDKGMMMKEHMDMMKKTMSDPANAPTAEDMAKAKAMHEMASMMAKDPECKKMCMDMMKGDKMMMPSADAVKMAKEAMMKDPAAMKMVMAQAMMMSSMGDKPGMDKPMMDGKMNH